MQTEAWDDLAWLQPRIQRADVLTRFQARQQVFRGFGGELPEDSPTEEVPRASEAKAERMPPASNKAAAVAAARAEIAPQMLGLYAASLERKPSEAKAERMPTASDAAAAAERAADAARAEREYAAVLESRRQIRKYAAVLESRRQVLESQGVRGPPRTIAELLGTAAPASNRGIASPDQTGLLAFEKRHRGLLEPAQTLAAEVVRQIVDSPEEEAPLDSLPPPPDSLPPSPPPQVGVWAACPDIQTRGNKPASSRGPAVEVVWQQDSPVRTPPRLPSRRLPHSPPHPFCLWPLPNRPRERSLSPSRSRSRSRPLQLRSRTRERQNM